MAATDAITTVEVRRKTGASTNTTATLTINKRADRSYEFTGTNGRPVRAHSNAEMTALFAAVLALA